jgi:GTP pyrophosphokinase
MQELICSRMNVPNLEELYAGIGYGGVALSRVIAKVKDEVARVKAAEAKEAKLAAALAAKPRKAVGDTGVIVEGLDNCMVKFAKCCTPVPGDPIIGFITRGYGVSVHRQDCANAKISAREPGEDGRWIRTEWAEGEKHQYSTGIKITATNRVGLLSDLMTQLSNMKINVSELNAREDEDGNGVLYMTISVHDKGQLEFVINRLMRVSGVSEVKRIVAGG